MLQAAVAAAAISSLRERLQLDPQHLKDICSDSDAWHHPDKGQAGEEAIAGRDHRHQDVRRLDRAADNALSSRRLRPETSSSSFGQRESGGDNDAKGEEERRRR